MIEVTKYEKNDKVDSTLKSYFSIYIPSKDIYINRMCEFQKGDKSWVSEPSYSIKENHEEKYKFYPLISFGKHEKFLEACRKALKDYKKKLEDGKEDEAEVPF